jgi:two-component system sensor histidine kinase/response regulator
VVVVFKKASLIKLKFSFTLIFSFLYLSGFAAIRGGDVDSIKNLVDNSLKNQDKPDTITINRLNKLAADYFQINPDSSYYFGQKSIELSKKIHYSAGIAGGLLQTGRVNSLKGKSDQARQNFSEAVSIYKNLHDYKGLSTSYIAYGRMYNLLANYKLALNYLDLALQISKQNNDEKGQTDAYKNIGIVNYSKGELSGALDYYYKALFIAVKNHYKVLSGEIYNDIGVVLQSMEVYPNALGYFNKALIIVQGANDVQGIGTMNENIGEVLIAQADYDQAIIHLNKALKIAKQQDDIDGLGSLYTDMGLCYGHKNQPKLAISYLDTSLQITNKYKFVYNQAYTLIGLATVYNIQKDYANAYKYAMQGQKIAMGNLSVRANAALQLNKSLAGLGKYADAYKFLNQYINLTGQLKNNESIEKLTSYNYEFDFAAKELSLKEHEHEKDLLYKQKIRSQKLLNIIFITVILAMVTTAFIYYRQKRRQQKINAMLAERNEEVLDQKASLKDQAQKLNELNTLKDRLISILAHDLRAPLSTLRGLFGLLQDSSITHQELIEMIPNVLKKLEYTSDFLDTLLFWINSQMENFDSSAKSFSIKEMVNYEIESYHGQAALKGITLVDSVPNDLMASADPNSIRIVIRNLITNAIKFSGENDIIEIIADVEGNDTDSVLIKIKDTGMGISPEQLKKLFKNKVESKTGTNQELGTGMGLLFCKDLIEKCNGKIWVTSQQGVGTEFSFNIPAALSLQVS